MLAHVGSHVRLLLAGAIVSAAAARFRPAEAQLMVRETSLGIRPDGMLPQTIEVSAAMRLGYVVETSGGDAVVVDGVRGRLYSDINTRGASYIAPALRRYFPAGRRPYLTFSPDGMRFASAAKQGDRALVVVDGAPGPLFDAVHWDSTPFSPDSRYVAYVATREGRYVVVRDGVVGRAYDAIRSLEFTPDSKHLIYVAQRDGREYLVIDGKEGEGAERIPGKPMVSVVRNGPLYIVPGTPRESFITTAGRVVTVEQRGAMWDVFIDGVPSGLQSDPNPYAVASPDGRRIACAVRRGGTWFVAVEGAAGRTYDEVGNVTFSPDNRHLAYTAKRGDKWTIVVDGAESPPYDEIVGFPASDRLGRDSFNVLVRRGTEDLRVTVPWARR